MAELYDEFQRDGFTILAVNIQESKDVVENYVKKENVRFPVLLDRDGNVAGKYGVRFQPDHFLINKQGELIGRAPGAKNLFSKEIRNLIRSLLSPE
ncbi:MAG: TlpA family protein disulfide reductase [Proteobacteria bacterium]|nr:TlpA family protein disulfide reductase [Pseudomonadota bacterium]